MTHLNKPSFESLYHVLSSSFAVIVVLSNIISAKMIRLPFTNDFNIPAGLITYPLTFLLSDLVTELFGAKKAKLMVYIALLMNVLSFGIIYLTERLPASLGMENEAFSIVMGLSALRIFSSLFAYFVSQIADIQIYSFLKSIYKERFLGLRANLSTFISQGIDTIMIDMIYLYWGMQMSFAEVYPIMIASYFYKATFSLVNTPFFYLAVNLIKKNWQESKKA